jgi:hypothetical protein
MSKVSKYTGVTWNKRTSKWTAKSFRRGRQIYLGEFHDELKASEAYENFIASHHRKRLYSPRDKRYITNNYLFHTDEFIGNYLNRTTEAIKQIRQRMGLYKDEDIEMIKDRKHSNVASLWLEISALRNYIELGKGGQIAKDRLNEIIARVNKKPRIHQTRRKTALSEIAKVYEMFISGKSKLDIAAETDHLLPTVYWWIYGIQGYKGRNKTVLVLDSKINFE